MSVKYSIVIKSNHWPRRKKKIKKISNIIFKNNKYLSFDYRINYFCNIVLVNDFLMKKFNNYYKNTKKTTDVLTFVSEINKNNSVIEKHCDIMISAETALKDALELKENFYDHITHLIIHSILHINGYSHDNNKNYLKMKNKEIKVLNMLRISNPYL